MIIAIHCIYINFQDLFNQHGFHKMAPEGIEHCPTVQVIDGDLAMMFVVPFFVVGDSWPSIVAIRTLWPCMVTFRFAAAGLFFLCVFLVHTLPKTFTPQIALSNLSEWAGTLQLFGVLRVLIFDTSAALQVLDLKSESLKDKAWAASWLFVLMSAATNYEECLNWRCWNISSAVKEESNVLACDSFAHPAICWSIR